MEDTCKMFKMTYCILTIATIRTWETGKYPMEHFHTQFQVHFRTITVRINNLHRHRCIIVMYLQLSHTKNDTHLNVFPACMSKDMSQFNVVPTVVNLTYFGGFLISTYCSCKYHLNSDIGHLQLKLKTTTNGLHWQLSLVQCEVWNTHFSMKPP